MKEILKISGAYILFIFLVISIILISTFKLADSRSFGDTLGGVLSPLFGIISVYLLYQSFKLQNEQLVDQKSINFSQISFMHLEELKNMVKQFELGTNDLFFNIPLNGARPISTEMKYKGYEAIFQFILYFGDIGSSYVDYSSNEILAIINKRTKYLIIIHSRLKALKSSLTKDHSEFAIVIYQQEMNIHFEHAEQIYSWIRRYIELIGIRTADYQNAHQIVVDKKIGYERTIKLYIEYSEMLNYFVSNNLIEIDTTPPIKLLDTIGKVDLSLLEGLDLYIKYKVKSKK